MDKQLLEALNNLSDSLEMIAQALDRKGTSNTTTTNALQSGDFSKQLTEINVSLKSIKADTTKILEQQNTILSMQKKKENDKKTGLFEESGEDPKKQGQIKKGVTTIILIAVAVLAIGLAFKLVGKIDFLSVVGLSLAVVLMAIAFEKITKLKLEPKEAFSTSLVIVMMAVAITMASWIMAFIEPIGFTQLLTAVLIAAMFAVLSNYLENIFITSILFKKLNVSPIELVKVLVTIAAAITVSSWILSFIKPMSFIQAMTGILIAGMFAVVAFNLHKIAIGVVLFQDLNISPIELVKVLVGIAAAITASSWILSLIRPMSFGQAITGILIAAMFAVVSFNLDKIAKGVVAFKLTGVKPTDLLLVLVGIAAAITASSWILGFVQPIGLWQFVTVLGIALVFALMSYFMEKLASGIVIIEKFLGKGKIYLIPLVLVALATAIALSSMVLQNTVDLPFMLILKILLLGATLAIVTLLMTPAVMLMGMIPVEDLTLGVLGVIAIAGAIALSSQILALGKYDKYPDWKWALGVGLSLISFGGAALVLGALIMETGGLGLAALAIGAGAILLVAATVVSTSYILGSGKYDKFPSYEWSLSVGLSMTAFGLAMGVLGTFILGTLGLGMIGLVAGGKAVLLIAQTIVDSSFILRKGNYTGGPTKKWAEGISLAIGAFAQVYSMLTKGGIMKAIFGSGPTPEQFTQGIRTISQGIVDAAAFFADPKVKNNFNGGPPKEWAEGVGTAIAAFSPVYAALMDNGFFGSNVSAEDMKNGILTISDGIITAADKFGNNIAKFDLTKVPSQEWGENVGASLQAFAPVFEFMKGSGWWKSNKAAVDDMTYGITAIAYATIKVANLFAMVKPGVWNSYPTEKWINGVSSSINGFVNLSKVSSGSKMNDIFKTNIITLSMLGVAKTLASGSKYFSKAIDPNYMKNLSKNVFDYVRLANSITGFGTLNGVKSLFGLDPISQAANGMIKIAGAYDKLANALKKFGGALQAIDGSKVTSLRKLTGNLAILAAMNKENLDVMMRTLEEKSSVFAKLLDGDTEKLKRPTVGDKKVTVNTGFSQGPNPKRNTHQQLEDIIKILTRIGETTTSLDEFISIKTDGKVQSKNLTDSGGFFSSLF